MACQINKEKCVECGACAANCPMQCIHLVNDKYEINSNECISCGTCSSICPMSAIEPAK